MSIRLLFTTLLLIDHGVRITGANAKSHTHSQVFRISQARMECNKTITAMDKPDDGGLYCDPIWDNIMCWPNYTAAGTLVQQPCAGYIEGFSTRENAHRFCTADGTWAIHPDVKINTSWTNYMNCAKKKKRANKIDEGLVHNMPNVILISTVGYGISLAFLMVATILMVGLRKLHCQRNTIHINLFLSFIFRAVVALVKNGALDKGFAFSWDFQYDQDGRVVFDEDKPHWECKLLNILQHYTLGANYTWIFVEGLYLHTLIFFAVFSQSKKYFKLYIVVGWSFPLIFVIIWIILRIYKHNKLCWNTHERNYYWVLEAPNIASISINFFFFLNIIRVLFTKIRNCNTRDPRRFRKLAKSTLVLIPLFGVYYIIFIVLARHKQPDIAIVHMYMEMTLNSFQGIVVALLFCFFNGEVRAEISKRWNRHWLTRRYSSTSGRSSRAFSTSSFTLRERISLSNIGSPTNDHNDHKYPPNSKRAIFDITVNVTADFEKKSLETLARVPSESKVTFADANGHLDSSSLTGRSKPDVAKIKELPSNPEEESDNGDCSLISDGEEFNRLLPVQRSGSDYDAKTVCPKNPLTVNGSKEGHVGNNRKSSDNSRVSSSARFPSSNGLSLVRDPVNL